MKFSATIKLLSLLLVISATYFAQSITVIDDAVTWNTDQIINTIVTVEDGGTLTIEAGVTVDFCWADLNADNIGDLHLVVKDGGTLILKGTADDPVIFQPIVCPVPPEAEHNRWGGIILEGMDNPQDVIKYARIYYSRVGIELNRPVDVSCVSFHDIGTNPVVVNNFANGGTVNLESLVLNSSDGAGIIVRRPDVKIRYCNITNAVNNGIEIYASDVTIDWCEIKDITGTGLYNSPDATNTIVQNTLIQDCTGSGIFNLDGTITRILNCLITSNDYHGIVNSSGSVWIERTEISYNESRGIVSAGSSYTNSNYVSTINNYFYGYQIFPFRLESDILDLTGTAEDSTPEVIYKNSNIYDNDTATAYQVYTTAGNDPQADFTLNWWGNNCCLTDYIFFTNANSINFTNWILTGPVANTTPSLFKTLSVIYPVDNQDLIQGQDLTVEWNKTGFIQMVKVFVYDEFGIEQNESAVICNANEYTFTTTGSTRQIMIKSWPDETVLSNLVSFNFANTIRVISPAADDILLGNETTDIEWVAPPGLTLGIGYVWDDSDPDTNNWVLYPIMDAQNVSSTDAKYEWLVPNDSSAYTTGRIIIFDINNPVNYAYSDSFTIRQTPPVQEGGLWQANTQTGHNMTVSITEDIICLDTSGAGTLVQEEDIYVGAFFIHPLNGPTCVGYQYLRFDASPTHPVLLTLWGDDPTTTSVIEGAPEDAPLIFKIWRANWSADEPEETLYPVSANDRTAEALPAEIVFNVDKLVSLEYLVYDPQTDDPLPVSDDELQNIVLREGWSYVSSYVNLGVNNTLAFDTTASNGLLTPPLAESQGGINMGLAPSPENFEILKDGDGNVYWVSDKTDLANPVIFYSFNQWSYLEGYSIMMNESSGNDTLRLVGSEIIPQQTQVPVSSGWNMIPYLRKTSMPVSMALNNILSNVEIVKDQDGNVYWPAQQINTIVDFQPGQAYLLRSTASDNLIYPANSTAAKNRKEEVLSPEHYITKTNSDNSSVICIPADVTSSVLTVGDELCVTDKNGDIVGSAVYNGGNTAIVVWGKSSFNQEFGLEENEAYRIRVWDSKNNTEITLQNLEFNEGYDYYTVNGISVLGKAGNLDSAVPVTYDVSQNYPNPFNPSTTIRFALPKDSDVKITVYNLLGEVVTVLLEEFKTAGYHEVKFDAGNISTGIYFYQVNAGDFNMVKKMSLIK